MKIEKLNIKNKQPKTNSFISSIRNLKEGECLRLTTAKEAINLQGTRGQLKKQGINISTYLDGDDLIVYKTSTK